MICDICKSNLSSIKYVAPNDIIIEVCIFYDVYITEVISKKQDLYLVNIRHKLFDMLYCNDEMKLSLKYIGSFFNNRDHTTIMHGIKQVKKYCEVYPDYKIEYQNLHKKIYGSLKFFKY